MEPIRIMDGPGADAAAALLRESGREVEIVQPPKVMQLWRYANAIAQWADFEQREGIESPSEPFLGLDADVRALWHRLTKALARRAWIDPEITELMAHGEVVPAPIRNSCGIPALRRDPGRSAFVLEVDEYGAVQVEEVEVSDRFAAAWLAEFDGSNEIADPPE